MNASNGRNIRSPWVRYVFACVAVGLAVVLRIMLLPASEFAPFLLFYPAIILTALYAGFGPGVLAIVLSVMAASNWLEPVGSLHVSPIQMVTMVVFVMVNLVIVWTCERLRRETRKAIRAEALRESSESITRALSESEERYRVMFESTVDAIITIDERGTIETVNPASERLFGYRAQEMVGQNVRMLMPSPYQEEHDRYLENYRQTGVKKIIGIGREVLALRKDGSTFPIRLAVSEMRIGDRRMFTGQVHDITERKRAEEALKQAKEDAEEANRAKDRFLAVLSHELRTPLTPALMVISSRESDMTLPVELREDLATARRNMEMEARLIDDLLDLNRVVHGKMKLNIFPQDLHAVLQNTLKICLSDLEAKGLRARLELAAFEHTIEGDSERLQQVFWNLLRNAAKFTPGGGEITVRSCNLGPGVIQVDVADTGMGIAPQNIQRLFLPFEQGDMAITQQFGGMGLGLAIGKAIVDLHGGKIWAHSEGPGKGSTFSVELPLTSSKVREDEGHLVSAAVKWKTAMGNRKLRILLVEDNADTLEILNRLLGRRGFSVVTALSMSDALAAAQVAREGGEKFDLLISDLGLADGDGRDLMRQLRDRDGLRGIAISGYGMDEDVEKSHAAGFVEHLTKPIQIEALLEAISRVVGISA